MPERLLVIGGDAAGMSAASQARRRRPAEELEIIAFERGRFTSYAACGIPYLLGGLVEDAERLVARTPQVFRDRFQIDARTGHEVVEIDTGAGRIRVREVGTGKEYQEAWDQLVVAVGAEPLRPPIPGIDAQGIFGVQTLEDGLAVERALADDPKNAVVVGGGYIGLEMAEAMVMRGLNVTLVEQAPQPMRTLDPEMGALVADALREVGVELRLGETVDAFETRGGRVTGVSTGEGVIPADVVILGLGTRPRSALAREAGIPVGETGGICTDLRMRSQVEGVWAAGDCIETFHRVSRNPVAIALGTHANKQGRIAGINLGGGYATFPGVVGTAVSKICAVEVARTGLNESEATEAGFAFESVTVESTTRAGYYPGAKRMKTKLLAEQGSGRLLGGQIVGLEGAAKRIDVVAACLWNEMTVDEMQGMDLSYAPPFSPVWDPVLITARKAAERVQASRGGR
ncbi:MAG: flavoprotein oxidoreductase [Gemmatimonadales bacterium]|nr:MAG: flavoprotein oxidoreductase [Gemmatimonadales bacterium]